MHLINKIDKYLVEALGTSRPRSGGPKYKETERRLKLHKKLMDDLIKDGVDKKEASKIAFEKVKKLTDKEILKKLQ